jgi:ABC-type polar amino acid transport system ATPase subunit
MLHFSGHLWRGERHDPGMSARTGMLLVVSGPSESGKTTLCRRLDVVMDMDDPLGINEKTEADATDKRL